MHFTHQRSSGVSCFMKGLGKWLINRKLTVAAVSFQGGPIAGTMVVSGQSLRRTPLVYANIDGQAVFEGDIVLGSVAEAEAMLQRAGDAGGPVLQSIGITGQQFRWPNATMPFTIDASLPNQQRVRDAIAHWEANTRIRFVERTAANAAQHPNFVEFRPGGGCSSNIGRRGVGRQFITLGASCTTGNTIHEIGHSLGLWHEQSREDRDTFVNIVFANITAGLEHNFTQHISDGDDLGPYDYGSIMHYPASAFSSNGEATIVALQPLPPGVVMGQRVALSQGDINGIHQLYPPVVATIKEITKDPIVDPPTTIKEVGKDPLFDPVPTQKEVNKDPITDPPTPTLKEVNKDPISDPPTFKEAGKDPFFDPTLVEGTGQLPFPQPGGAVPFVMGAPSQFGAQADLAQQVQQLSASVAALQQQIAALGGQGGHPHG